MERTSCSFPPLIAEAADGVAQRTPHDRVKPSLLVRTQGRLAEVVRGEGLGWSDHADHHAGA